MTESPARAARTLPSLPSHPQSAGDGFTPVDSNEGGRIDGPPILPPISSFNGESVGLQVDQQGTPPSGPSSLAAATPPQSPGFPPTSGGGKNRNPLTDLIDSEEQFVALMSAIIRVRFQVQHARCIQSLTTPLESGICMVKIQLPTART
jgi:hypothetical protein